MEKEEFAEVVIGATDSLYRVSYAILGNDTDCEDAVSEAVAAAFTKLHTLRKEQYAKTWLTRILIHECYRVLRERKRVFPVGDDMENLIGFSDLRTKQDYPDLYEALMELSKEQRLAVVLYYLEGYPVKEIAKITGVTQGTVKSRLSRARKHLKDALEPVAAIGTEPIRGNETRGQEKFRAV